ncbi:2-oxoacid:acceptor oxidoreductase family protein [Clostridium argentinense]|uniref:2-oxoacid:acceptor oxidoreductase family protein n=1 Tax=Clostridium argentinense TaxID=29341 RepID=UPI00214F8359|nr:2-oxoacid:acceptor oxidoreductase family protein [Clostridium argentinense]
MVKYSEEILKNSQSINMLCLGILAETTKMVSYEAFRQAACKNVLESSIDKNLLAFQAGINMVSA